MTALMEVNVWIVWMVIVGLAYIVGILTGLGIATLPETWRPWKKKRPDKWPLGRFGI